MALALVGLSGCGDDFTPATERTGQVNLSTMGVEVNSDAVEVGGESRAEHDISQYIVKIFSADGSLVANWAYSEMPEIFTLPVANNYKVEVMSHKVDKAEWERPLYVGSKTFNIEDSKITDVGAVKCVFSSLKVSIRFEDKLVEAMSNDVKVTIVTNDAGTLEYTADEVRAGYFEVIDGSNTLAAYFTGTVNGAKEDFHNVFTDIKAGQHRIITYRLKGNNINPDPITGTINPGHEDSGINVDFDMETVNGDAPVNPNEDPVTPDNNPGGEVFKEELSSKYDSSAQTLTIEAGAGITSLVLTAATDGGADFTDFFASVNGADLASADKAAALSAIGLPSGVASQKKVEINLATLIEKAKEFEGNHTFTFTSQDASTPANTALTVVNVKGANGIEPFTFEKELAFDDEDLPNAGKNSADAEGVSGLVKIHSEYGMANLFVTIESTNSNFVDAVSDLMPLSFDLAHLKAGEENIGNLLPANDKVLNQHDIPFDITSFIPLLKPFEGTHKFRLHMVDNEGNECKKVLTIISAGN